MSATASKFPPVELVEFHATHRSICCQQCGRPFHRGCGCVVDVMLLPSKPHQAREWGYKGTMVLPPEHFQTKQ